MLHYESSRISLTSLVSLWLTVPPKVIDSATGSRHNLRRSLRFWTLVSDKRGDRQQDRRTCGCAINYTVQATCTFYRYHAYSWTQNGMTRAVSRKLPLFLSLSSRSGGNLQIIMILCSMRRNAILCDPRPHAEKSSLFAYRCSQSPTPWPLCVFNAISLA